MAAVVLEQISLLLCQRVTLDIGQVTVTLQLLKMTLESVETSSKSFIIVINFIVIYHLNNLSYNPRPGCSNQNVVILKHYKFQLQHPSKEKVVHVFMHQWRRLSLISRQPLLDTLIKLLLLLLLYRVNLFRARELSINGKTHTFSVINSLDRLVINTSQWVFNLCLDSVIISSVVATFHHNLLALSQQVRFLSSEVIASLKSSTVLRIRLYWCHLQTFSAQHPAGSLGDR